MADDAGIEVKLGAALRSDDAAAASGCRALDGKILIITDDRAAFAQEHGRGDILVSGIHGEAAAIALYVLAAQSADDIAAFHAGAVVGTVGAVQPGGSVSFII